MNIELLIENLTKAICFQYKEDPTKPSVIISLVDGQYYCSIVRYTAKFGIGKTIVTHAKSPKLIDALKIISNNFLTINTHIKNPINDLDMFLKENK